MAWLRRVQVSQIVMLVLCFSALAPVLWSRFLPLTDGPSHEARAGLLHSIVIDGQTSPFYEITSFLLPNIGFDVIGALLAGWLGPNDIGRVFLLAALVLTLLGGWMICRGQANKLANFTVFTAVLFNLYVVLGFYSYIFGVALAFVFIPLRRAAEKIGLVWQFAIGSIFGLALLFCHVEAFMVYGVILAGVHAHRVLQSPRNFWRAFSVGFEFVPGLLLFQAMHSISNAPSRFEHPYFITKIIQIIKSVSSANIIADGLTIVALVIFVLMVLLERVSISREYFIGAVGLLVMYFIVPQHMGGGSYVDQRLPMVGLMAAVLSVRFENPLSRVARLLLSLAVIAVLGKQIALASAWSASSAQLAAVAKGLQTLPEGAVILQSSCDPDFSDLWQLYAARQTPLRHAASYAAFDNHRFVASGFAILGQQPISVRPPFQPFKDVQDKAPFSVCTVAGFRDMVDAAQRAMVASDVENGGVPPVFLLLIRPPAPQLLAPMPIIATLPGPIEIYQIEAE